MDTLEELLQDYPVVVDCPVAWGEMDSFQHVNNVVFFRYFENARIVYSQRLGLHDMRERTGIGPILGATSCRYKFPLTYPDTVSIGAKIIEVQEDRFTMKYVVVSHKHLKVAAEGDGVIVMYDYRRSQKTTIPDEIRKKIASMEQG
jgi:acyl-CoA thioester hydrolase